MLSNETAAVTRLQFNAADTQNRPADWDEFFCDDCPATVSLVGKSPAMRKTLNVLRRIANSNCNPVLIVGESGTGKELAAQAVHAFRGGSSNNFVAVNCAALTANLLESELFGHVRGSFTGADRDKTGLFEAAGTGTIFLDEISEMPLDLQAKLLRVIQERKFRKVGGTKDIACHATIIASSNRDLLAEANTGNFRKDLYYRLAVFPTRMPALRDKNRRSDVLLLARHFLKNSQICDATAKHISPAAEQFLLSHDWPGNVRELRNIIDRALILEDSEKITPESIIIDRPLDKMIDIDLDAPAAAISNNNGVTKPKDFSLETAEKEFIMRALKETGWQRTRAASLLGITRATLHSKLKRYGIKPPQEQQQPTAEVPMAKEACA